MDTALLFSRKNVHFRERFSSISSQMNLVSFLFHFTFNRIILVVVLSLNSIVSYGQLDFGEEPCLTRTLEIKEQIVDSVEFIAHYEDFIDLTNENCRYALAEGYFNQIPDENLNGLCMLYFEGTPPTDQLNFIDFFDRTEEMTPLIEKLKFAFITGYDTEIWETFETPEEFAELFALDIRNALRKKH